MYILITEGGEGIFATEKVSDGDLQASDDGLLDIIDISDNKKPVMYFDGKWIAVEKPNWPNE